MTCPGPHSQPGGSQSLNHARSLVQSPPRMLPSLPNADGAFVRCWEDREINTRAPTPPAEETSTVPAVPPACLVPPHSLWGHIHPATPRSKHCGSSGGCPGGSDPFLFWGSGLITHLSSTPASSSGTDAHPAVLPVPRTLPAHHSCLPRPPALGQCKLLQDHALFTFFLPKT